MLDSYYIRIRVYACLCGQVTKTSSSLDVQITEHSLI